MSRLNPFIYLFLLLSLLSSCSLIEKITLGNSKNSKGTFKIARYKKQYELLDKSGQFIVDREVGTTSKVKLVTKTSVKLFSDPTGKELEKGIAIGHYGVLNKTTPMLRPSASQYKVWFEKKEYSTTMKVNIKDRSIKVTMKSPEKQWNGTIVKKFPKFKGAFCFFSQLVECIYTTGFISKAMDKNAGQMNLYVIWDGYPYIQEQYLYLPNEIFSKAKFLYDGTVGKLGKRFSLNVGKQTIFYFISKKGRLKKYFWVAQGLSMTELK